MTISAGLDRWTNNPQTTLNGAITNVATSMVVTSALSFPSQSTANFRVLIDSEVIQVYGGQGTTTWTILRGLEGTSATSHSNGATVTLQLSAFDFNSFRQEFSVIAYGAAGDGVTDDSTAFQNAINDAHAQTTGGVVFIPTLNYKIVSTLTTYANVILVTYGATFTGAGAASVTPLIKWGLTGTLTLPGALTVSSGGAAITGAISSTSTVTGTAHVASGLTGATAASRYVGATASGHPVTGAFLLGDFSVDQTGVIWICTVAGSPGTWVQVSGALTYGTTTQALASAGAAGTSTSVSREDHVHAWTGLGVLSLANVWTQNNTFNAGITGTLLTAAQGNVTSLGTLSSLTVSGSLAANGGITMGSTLAKGANALTGSNNASDAFLFLGSATGAQVWIQSGTPTGNNGDVWLQA